MPQQIMITLSDEMARFVHDKVAIGEYADGTDVIRDGLKRLLTSNQAMEEWLVQEVASAYDELKRHPERALSMSQVREALAAEHTKRTQLL